MGKDKRTNLSKQPTTGCSVDAYEVEHEFPLIGRRVMLLYARRLSNENG